MNTVGAANGDEEYRDSISNQAYWNTKKGHQSNCPDCAEKNCYKGKNNTTETFETKIKGYDDTLNFGEDWDLQRRLNEAKFKTGKLENPKILHDEGTVTLKKAYNSKKFYGKSMAKFFEKNPERKSQTYSAKNIFIEIILKNFKKILIHPFLFICALILKTVEYIGAWRGIKENENFSNK